MACTAVATSGSRATNSYRLHIANIVPRTRRAARCAQHAYVPPPPTHRRTHTHTRAQPLTMSPGGLSTRCKWGQWCGSWRWSGGRGRRHNALPGHRNGQLVHTSRLYVNSTPAKENEAALYQSPHLSSESIAACTRGAERSIRSSTPRSLFNAHTRFVCQTPERFQCARLVRRRGRGSGDLLPRHTRVMRSCRSRRLRLGDTRLYSEHTHTHTHTRAHTHTRTHRHTHRHRHTDTQTHTQTHTRTHARTQTHRHIHTDIHTVGYRKCVGIGESSCSHVQGQLPPPHERDPLTHTQIMRTECHKRRPTLTPREHDFCAQCSTVPLRVRKCARRGSRLRRCRCGSSFRGAQARLRGSIHVFSPCENCIMPRARAPEVIHSARSTHHARARSRTAAAAPRS